MSKIYRFNPRPVESIKLPGKELPTEHDEQRAFIEWFRKSARDADGDNPVRIFAIPNGGKRGKAEAARLKSEGVTAGVPDLYVPECRLWIEFKRQKGGAVSKEQKDWHKYLEVIGDSVIICKGCADAINKLNDFHKARTK